MRKITLISLKHKKTKAFTLIELMTTTLIMAIIVCAAIPFAMKKDIQKRAVAGHIGVFECFYDENGQLWQHIREKDGTQKTTKITNGETCTFNPNADYTRGAKNFQIVAIGGGGAGGTYNTHGTDTEIIDAIHTNISSGDTLESNHIKKLMDHGRLKFGTLSNAGGVNAWYWDGKTQTEQCYNDFWRSGCTCHGRNSYTSNNCYCSNPNHQDFKVTCRKTANSSNMDFISVNNYGPRLCSLKRKTEIFDYDIKEDDIFQAIHKYYGIGGSYPYGDIIYDVKAPTGLASCACLNDPVGGSVGSCMAGTIKTSQVGEAGVAYSLASHTGKLRGVYMGDQFQTGEGTYFESIDEKGSTSPSNHCSSALSLAATSFGCGTAKSNAECSGNTSIKDGTGRGFPSIYHWANKTASSNVVNLNADYQKIKMSYTHREDTARLDDYGGDVHFRLITHAGGNGHAIVPRGAHGSNPTKGGQRIVTAFSGVNPNFGAYITANSYSANNKSTATACDTPSNKYSYTAKNTVYSVYADCSDTCSYTATCGSGSNTYSCTKYKSCSGYGEAIYWPNKTKAKASCTITGSCTGGCSVEEANTLETTDSAGTCEHLNCCYDFNEGSKQYTVRYHTGTSFVNKQSSGKAEVGASSRTLNCGDHLYVYRQIRGVPFERAFVASAGQNGAVRQGSYPKLDEELVLQPGKGGVVSGSIEANGKPSIVKKKDSNQVIVNAPGGLKGSSDKLNDTWVGPCALFSLRENFNPENPGCMARPDVMRKPTYNSLLMSNSRFLKSIKHNHDNVYSENNKYFPGLGGDGAYSNVFPDRFLLSQAIKDQVRLITNYVGPNQRQTWGDELTFIGLDSFTSEEFIGKSGFASSFQDRLSKLSTASQNFLSTENRRKGRVPNFMEASNGNDGAIVIIW